MSSTAQLAKYATNTPESCVVLLAPSFQGGIAPDKRLAALSARLAVNQRSRSCAHLSVLLHASSQGLIEGELQGQLGDVPQQRGQQAPVQAQDAVSCHNAACTLHLAFRL